MEDFEEIVSGMKDDDETGEDLSEIDLLFEALKDDPPTHDIIDEGSILTRAVILTEWMDPEGRKVVIIDQRPQGFLASWDVEGILREGLKVNEERRDEAEDDEDPEEE